MGRYGAGLKGGFMKFRKKVLVDGIEFNPAHKPTREIDLPDGVRGTSYSEIVKLLGTSGCSKEEPYWSWEVLGIVETLEGNHVASPGDWIMTGFYGEKWPIKPNVLEATYEKVEIGDAV
jgi:hypothetical protein